jgi:hypothetical protein
MLLVASETGHVYTFATKKLQPMITSEIGKNLIRTCLSTSNDGNQASFNDNSNNEIEIENQEFFDDEESQNNNNGFIHSGEEDFSHQVILIFECFLGTFFQQ